MAKMGVKADLPSQFRARAPKDADPELLYRIVEKTFQGMNVTHLAEELNLSRDTISRYKKSTQFNKLMVEYIKYAVSQRAGELVDALFKQVGKGNINAINTGFKVLGAVDTKEAPSQGDTSITVVLPSSQATGRVIEVTGEVSSETKSAGNSEEFGRESGETVLGEG